MIVGVLFYKTAVCEGIAKTFKFLLNALDIKCIVVKGKATDDLSGNLSADTPPRLEYGKNRRATISR